MKKLFFVSLFLLAFNALATPKKVVGWYLGEPKTAALEHYIFLAKLAENDSPYDCLPMGDGCFHPQLGYLPNKPTVLKESDAQKKEKQKELDTNLKVKTFNSLDTDMVDCDKSYGFDIFCGKEKKEASRGGDIEIWLDTSSSMKRTDYSSQADYCQRREMISHAFDHCPKNSLSVYVYDTSKKAIGDFSGACVNYGMNDDKRFVQWLKDSDAKKLFFVTDLEEYTPFVRAYLDTINAEVKGVDTTLLTGKDLMKLAEEIVKACK